MSQPEGGGDAQEAAPPPEADAAGAQSPRFQIRTQTAMHEHIPSWAEKNCPTLVVVMNSHTCECTIGAVILANCLTIGMTADTRLGKAEDWITTLEVIDHFWTAFFVLELIGRLIVEGPSHFYPHHNETWGNFLDAGIVFITGVIPAWIFPIFGTSDSSGVLDTLTVLRALRLVRLVRVVQSIEAFKEVLTLIKGLMESGRTLVWTVVVVFFITYIFAVFGVVLITSPLKEMQKELGGPGQDSTLDDCILVLYGVMPFMFTLIQVLTLDSWTGLVRPVQDRIGWSWMFWYAYIAVAAIVMMNLVTAVIVDNALQNSAKDADAAAKELEKAKLEELNKFKAIFKEMDDNADGQLTWGEFENAFDDKELSNALMLLGIDKKNCKEIFDLLDTGDGALNTDEFFEGIGKMGGLAQSKELLRATKVSELLMKNVTEHREEVYTILDDLARNTPGAKAVAPRSSTPRASSSPRKSPSLRSVSPGADAEAMLGAMSRLEEVAKMVVESRDEFRQAIAQVTKDVSELKGKLP